MSGHGSEALSASPSHLPVVIPAEHPVDHTVEAEAEGDIITGLAVVQVMGG